MPELIIAPPTGAQDVTYTYRGQEELVLYAVSANVTTVANTSGVEVICKDQSGAFIAISRTRGELDAGLLSTATFAPDLPDSAAFQGALLEGIIQTGLAATPLNYGSTVTVHPIANDAFVTQARLWVVSPELAFEQSTADEPDLHVFLLPRAG